MTGKRTQAVVLLSGGIDSTTVLAKTVKDYWPPNTHALSIAYGQRHSTAELEASEAIAKHFRVSHTLIEVPLGTGGLTDTTLRIPNKSYAELGEGVSPTYVPFRNGALLSIATSFAHGLAGRDDKFVVYYGAHAEDAENYAYPDCSMDFVRAMNKAVEIGTYGMGMVVAPFGGVRKSDIVRSGETYDVPWELTWSCYKGGRMHCGVCPTCQARKQAFKDARVTDPTEYAQ